jgi:hypothetical protein
MPIQTADIFSRAEAAVIVPSPLAGEGNRSGSMTTYG